MKLDKESSFDCYRNVVGPIEFALIVRFLEFIIQSYEEGGIELLKEFKEAILTSSELFKNIRKEYIHNIEVIKVFIEELYKIIESHDDSFNLINLLNGNNEMCSELTQLIFGKHCEEICNFLNVPVTFIQAGEYRILKEYKPHSPIFSSDKIIYLYHKDDVNSCLFYSRGKINLDASNPMPKVKLGKKPLLETFELPCGHIWDTKTDTEQVLTLRHNNPTSNLILKCPNKECYHIINTQEAKSILNTQFDYYFPIIVNKSSCIIDGITDKPLIQMDTEHSVCVDCMRCLIKYKLENPLEHFEYFDDNNIISNMQCPVPDCSSKFSLELYFRLLEGKELAEIIKNHMKAFKTITCAECNKQIENDNYTEHNECKAKYHKKCLLSNIVQCVENRGIHNVMCKGCEGHFEVSEVCSLFPKDSDIPALLKRNYEERAVSLKCPYCKKFNRNEDWQKRMIKCSCGKTICRLCIMSSSKNCYPRYEVIKSLYKIYHSEIILPCPNCMQLNIFIKKERIGVCVNCYANFCGECGADAEVIKYHGPKYHRPNCTRAKPKAKPVCPLCSKKKCKVPGKLDNGELPKNEVIMLK